MDLRHEWKHEMNQMDAVVLRQRLRAVMKTDGNAVDGKYEIRSLYFDNMDDKALMEKINGVSVREKFRIRYYNGDKSMIRLEKKSKYSGLGNKKSVILTEKEAQSIVDGDLGWMIESEQPLLQELYTKMKTQGLQPKTIVDYTREPFVFGPGNVRVTLDYNIRTGMNCTDFLNTSCITIPAGNTECILEVKWDAFLPDIIKAAVQLDGRHAAAFSKYQACRMYG